MGLDSKAYWLANRQSQCDFDLMKWENQNGERPRRSREKGSTEDLLWVIVIDCDYEWL
jgi:hypothetical protein